MSPRVQVTRKRPGPKPRAVAQVREQCQVRLLPAERVLFQRAATSCGLGISAWLRMLGLREVAKD